MGSDLYLSIEPNSIRRNAYGQVLNFTVSDNNWNGFDLTSYTTVQFIAWLHGAQDFRKVLANATKNAGTNGTGSYTVQSGDFDLAPRWYECQVYLSKTGEQRYTKPADLYVGESGKAT